MLIGTNVKRFQVTAPLRHSSNCTRGAHDVLEVRENVFCFFFFFKSVVLMSVYCRVLPRLYVNAILTLLSCSGSQPVARDSFHRGRLKP